MNDTRMLAVALGAVAIALFARPVAAEGEPVMARVSTPTVEYTAQCFVDSPTVRRYCEKRATVARLIDCTHADSTLQCRMKYMQLMGKSGWNLIRVGGGSYHEWWEAPLYFYERTTLRTADASQ